MLNSATRPSSPRPLTAGDRPAPVLAEARSHRPFGPERSGQELALERDPARVEFEGPRGLGLDIQRKTRHIGRGTDSPRAGRPRRRYARASPVRALGRGSRRAPGALRRVSPLHSPLPVPRLLPYPRDPLRRQGGRSLGADPRRQVRKLSEALPPETDGRSMKILAISDLHGDLRLATKAALDLQPDLLLCCGDWGDADQVGESDLEGFLDLCPVLSTFGNHDPLELLARLKNR